LGEIQKSYQAAVDQKKQQQIASETESQRFSKSAGSRLKKLPVSEELNEFKAQQEAQLRDNQKKTMK